MCRPSANTENSDRTWEKPLVPRLEPNFPLQNNLILQKKVSGVDVVVNFLFQLIFIFPLFWGMVMYANEFKTKEKQKLTEIKN